MTNTTKAIAMLGVVACLGLTTLPLSSYAAGELTENTQVGVVLQIENTLEISADKDNSSNKVDLSEGSDTVTVTVTSTNKTGYMLNLKASGTNGVNLVSENKDQIIPGGGTFAAPVELSNDDNSEWGYSVSGPTANNSVSYSQFTGDKYAKITTDDQKITDLSTPTGADGSETEVTFAASVMDTQPAGTYSGEVTFTATNNVIPTAS